MIKLIAIDLDGTLLDDNKEISQDNKIAIQKAKTYGIKIIIASGRPYFRVKENLQQLDLNHNTDYVITYNGGCILIGDNSEIIYEQRLSNQNICEIINFLEKYNGDIYLYCQDQIFSLNQDLKIANLKIFNQVHFEKRTIVELKKMDYANKIILADEEKTIDEIQTKIPLELNNQYNIVRSTPYFLEFLPNHVSKGNAIKILTQILNIDTDEIMVIGDEENDLSMFCCAKIKVAMKNANLQIKKRANFITESNNNSGVARAIEKFVFK